MTKIESEIVKIVKSKNTLLRDRER